MEYAEAGSTVVMPNFKSQELFSSILVDPTRARLVELPFGGCFMRFRTLRFLSKYADNNLETVFHR